MDERTKARIRELALTAYRGVETRANEGPLFELLEQLLKEARTAGMLAHRDRRTGARKGEDNG